MTNIDGYIVSWACDDDAHEFCEEEAWDEEAGERTACECDCHPYMRVEEDESSA